MKSISLDGKEIYPSKIVCIGQNYVEHIKELNNEVPEQPVIFIKPNSAISKEIHFDKDNLIHFEGEISFLIGSGKFKGVGFGLDFTKREVQTNLRGKGLPWERAKAFDGAAVFSEFVSFSGDIDDLRMELYINDDLVQSGGCESMINNPERLLSEAMGFLSFEDGDLLMTGTPKGVGPFHPGDRFIGKIFAKDKLIVAGSWVVK